MAAPVGEPRWQVRTAFPFVRLCSRKLEPCVEFSLPVLVDLGEAGRSWGLPSRLEEAKRRGYENCCLVSLLPTVFCPGPNDAFTGKAYALFFRVVGASGYLGLNATGPERARVLWPAVWKSVTFQSLQ